MDLSVLHNTFPVADEPGLDTFDSRLSEVSDLVMGGEFVAAADAIEAMLFEDVCDLRLLGYFVFGAFVSDGVRMIGPAIDGMLAVLDTNWEAFGPAKREKAAQTSIVWYAKQVMKRIQREESQQGPVWNDWASSMTQDDVDDVVKLINRFMGSVDERLGKKAPAALDALGTLRSWFQGFRNVVRAAEPEPEPEPEIEDLPEPEAAAPAPVAAAPVAAAPVAVAPAPPSDHSAPLLALLAKLAAFDKLVERGEFQRALIVRDDLFGILEDFDPVVYFPQYFKSFARLQAIHANDLTDFESMRDTPEWTALAALYRVDIDTFVEL